MNPVYLLLFLLTAGVNSLAQLLLKRGSMDLSSIFVETPNWFLRGIKIFTNPFVFSAGVSLGVGMLLWIWLISKLELSRAYPVNIALTIIITTSLSFFLFQESVGIMKFTGTTLIVAGLVFLLYG